MIQKSVLGRGLSSLIDEAKPEAKIEIIGSIVEIDIDRISVNPFQPRKNFDDEALNELAISIKELGIIQPITVRKMEGDNFQLITGERRYRASKIAGLTTIPAYVRLADDQAMLEMALVENIQREDLDAIEIALSYNRLITECNFTQETLSDKVGKKRTTVTNYIRLLKLPVQIQHGIRSKKISMGHARAMVNVKDPETQVMIYEQIMKYDFSVRKVEEIVRQLEHDENKKASPALTKDSAGEYEQLKNHLTKFFGSTIEFKRTSSGKGKIVIPFNNDEDLEKILEVFDNLQKTSGG